MTDLNAAQDALNQAEADAINARYDYLRAKAEIEAILGRKL
ncbi:MAG: TolC family protein [Gemmatimonadales bacterium]